MIYSVHGKLIHTESGFAVVECAGVGYKCLTTLSTLSRLPRLGEEATLYTHLNVREDAVDLFGFYDQGELSCFKMLISVSGVGPKAALSILYSTSPEKFALCVATGDVKSLKCPGVGPKIAQRIVLELKDKVSSEAVAQGFQAELPAAALSASGPAAEAISALVVLGYSQSEAAVAVGQCDPALPVEEMIKFGLKKLATNL